MEVSRREREKMAGRYSDFIRGDPTTERKIERESNWDKWVTMQGRSMEERIIYFWKRNHRNRKRDKKRIIDVG